MKSVPLRALALDFDGVVCDALEESLLVTWYGHQGARLADFGPVGLGALPRSFVDRFVRCRSFARHLGHFYASLVDGFERISTQGEFDAAYAALSEVEVELFVRHVTEYRSAVRERMRAQWLSRHVFYDGMAAVVTNSPAPIYIVTAKDSASVLELLAHFGVLFDRSRVFGELRDKSAALGEIKARHGVRAEELGVVDDNVYNALAAHRPGYSARWALWGFRAPGHEALAAQHGLPTVTLDALTRGHFWVEVGLAPRPRIEHELRD